ncbi:pilin protein [Stenotrophomonas maltophilia]|nr:pilin protein [Stenotrophomonas maltophilia]TIE57926.1 pilin protein [Stenotrophomonas maltophilia]
MSRRVWWVMAVLCGLVLLVPRAKAQRPPDQDPIDISHDISMSWDRSALPGDIELLPRRTILAYERALTLSYGQLYMTCSSSSDSSSGSCPESDTGELPSGKSSAIPLRFTEQRSGMEIDVEAHGNLFRIAATPACESDYWATTPRPLWSSSAPECNFLMPAGTGAELRVPPSELEKLVAGRWTAHLVLALRKPPHQQLATYSFKFDFTITDHNAVSIYFPLFDQVTPHVGLNLQYDPIAQTIGGRTQLDMCLYDGLGSQSSYLGVTVHDSGAQPPGPSGYSVWHVDGSSDASQRVDYTVTLDHNGSALPMRNGVEQLLHGIDTARLRLVLLPGMTQPVFCVPTPLTLETPRVPVSTKRPGYYSGDLKVELRVPTVTP